MSHCLVRRASVADAEAIAEVSVATWRAAYEGLLPADYLDQLQVETRSVRLAAQLNAGAPPFWVARVDSLIAGFSVAGPSHDDMYEGWAKLGAIYVLPRFQGRGIGCELLRHTVMALLEESFSSLYCEALVGNASADRFYKRLGARIGAFSSITIGGNDYPQQAYEWSYLTDLAETLAR